MGWRWRAAALPTIEQWFADLAGLGVDSPALYGAAQAAIAAEAS